MPVSHCDGLFPRRKFTWPDPRSRPLISGVGCAPTNRYPARCVTALSISPATSLNVTPSLVKKRDPPSEMVMYWTASSLCPAFCMNCNGIAVNSPCSSDTAPSPECIRVKSGLIPPEGDPAGRKSLLGEPDERDTPEMARITSTLSHTRTLILMKIPCTLM